MLVRLPSVESCCFTETLKQEMSIMKRIIAAVLSCSFFSIGIVGCAEKSSMKTETKVTTPTGTKTVTEETHVKETGKVPPDKVP
jgi:hypothetical protein